MTKARTAKPAKKSPKTKKRHPQAGKKMMGADIIMQVLSDEGVDVVFGYSGGAILPTWDAIFRWNKDHEKKKKEQIRLVVPANEQGAGFMAAGYSRASGRVGVSIVTSGPGATNSVTPVRDCMSDSVPMVLLCGQVPTGAIGTDAFQEAPVFNTFLPCAKHVFLVTDPEKLEATIRTAFLLARTGRPGPVVVDLPKDVQNAQIAFKGEGTIDFRGYYERMDEMHSSIVSEKEAKAFFKILKSSDRPLMYVGGGAITGDAAKEIRKFSKLYQIPVVTTLMGIGAVDTTDKLSMHMLGMHGMAYANYAVDDCDFLISIGSRFDDRVAGKVKEFAPNARNIAHIDIDAAEINKVKVVTWSHVGSAKATLETLMKYGKDFKKDYSKWVSHVVELKKKHAFSYNRESNLIQPHYVLEVLNNITRGDAIIATGVGQHQMWAAQCFDHHTPRSWLTSGSMGTMGFGLPAAIGAQLACPESIVIDVDGDGSIRMNLGELETAITYDVPVKVLLLNNQGDGMVRQWQKLMYGFRFSGTDKTLHAKDFILAAKADGFQFARRLEKKKDVEKVLHEFVKFEGPAFLEVRIDPDAMVFPMVGPGKSYREMMTGDFIEARDYSKIDKEADDKYDMF